MKTNRPHVTVNTAAIIEVLETRTLLSTNSPFIDVEILGSTTPTGSYSNSLKIRPGQTVYLEVEVKMAGVGATNHSKKITSLTAHPTAKTLGYDGINSLSFSLAEAGNFKATFGTAKLVVNSKTGETWDGGSGASAGTPGLDSLANVSAFQSPGVFAGATAYDQLLTGSLVVPHNAAANGISHVTGSITGPGGFQYNSNHTTGQGGKKGFLASGDPKGLVSFLGLTLITGRG